MIVYPLNDNACNISYVKSIFLLNSDLELPYFIFSFWKSNIVRTTFVKYLKVFLKKNKNSLPSCSLFYH